MVRFKKGHRNSKGEKAEWCIVSHKTGRVISSHKSKSAAEKHLGEIQMFKHMKNESMNLDEAKQILKNNGYIVEYIDHVSEPSNFGKTEYTVTYNVWRDDRSGEERTDKLWLNDPDDEEEIINAISDILGEGSPDIEILSVN
jgi:DNA-dependent RNA polymerase auxiliary subunit epsilon